MDNKANENVHNNTRNETAKSSARSASFPSWRHRDYVIFSAFWQNFEGRSQSYIFFLSSIFMVQIQEIML